MPPEASAATRRFTVSAADAGRRLDLYLASRLPELSRTRIQELIDQGHVRVSGRSPRRAHRIAAGEVVEIEILPRPPLSAQPEEIPIELLYEDPDFVVVNKPAGMVVHAGAGVSRGTLVNALLHRLGKLSNAGGVLRPGIVHRLDRGTSGALLVARNDAAHRALAAQFRARTVQKTYIALLHGRLARDAGVIALPIARDPRRRTRMTARLRSGREARTSWRVLLRLGNFTLVAAELHTGRTHQIRAHFAAIGHPLAGDTLYGAPQRARAGGVLLPPLGRVFLHAARLGFAAPQSGRPIEVRAPLDAGLRTYLGELAAAVETAPRQVDAALRGYL
ncbi:MAG TPA: RluA family pseudouridine synthase [Candidatus Acidoferrales bacterium]